MSLRDEMAKAREHAKRMGIVCLCSWQSYMVGSGCYKCSDPAWRAGRDWASAIVARVLK